MNMKRLFAGFLIAGAAATGAGVVQSATAPTAEAAVYLGNGTYREGPYATNRICTNAKDSAGMRHRYNLGRSGCYTIGNRWYFKGRVGA